MKAETTVQWDDIRKDASENAQILEAISQNLESLKNEIRNPNLITQCSGDGFFPRPAAPTCPVGYADSGQFTHSGLGGPQGFGGHCRTCLKIIK